ncbi:MAG: glycosyltransferase [bacterium]
MKNNTRKNILYIHHGGGQGGAPNSLLYLLNNLNLNYYNPIVACNFYSENAKEFFQTNGFNPIHISIARFSHFYSGWWSLSKRKSIQAIIKWLFFNHPSSKREFKKILKKYQPDIVHLNSLSIVALSPVAKKMGFPVILHVRETAIKLSLFDIRWYWIRWLTNKYVDKLIYISKDNQQKLTGKKITLLLFITQSL